MSGSAPSAWEELGRAKYVLVTTFRKSGDAVATPVWAVPDGGGLGMWTAANSGKVKRIRNRADVLVAACDVRGRPVGDAPAVPGRAQLLDPEETERYRALLSRKYGLIGKLSMLGSRLRRGNGGTIGVRITPL